jgi:hypothetical protein
VCVVARFLCAFVAKGAETEAEALVRDVRVVGTAVSSCSASSLAAVEFDTLSIDRRDTISSRVDAFKGNIEKREESALVRRLDDRLAPLEGVEMVAEGEWEVCDRKGAVDDPGAAKGPPNGGVLGRDDGGGKKERLVLGIL